MVVTFASLFATFKTCTPFYYIVSTEAIFHTRFS